MEFFCAKCKKKYDASLIGFNFFEIWHEEAAQRVEEILSEKYVDYAEQLAKFCRDRVNGGKDFIFSGSEIPGMMREKTGNAELVEGYFTLTLGWLCEKYEQHYGPLTELSDEAELLETPVLSKYIKVLYDIVEDQPVLYCIKDERDDPFTENGGSGRKRGFMRCCPENHALSQAVGKAKEFVIALAGSERAGKTSCLTAMSRALRDGLYQRDFDLSMDIFADDDSWKNMEYEIANYRQGYQVRKTDSKGDYTLNYSLLVKVGNARRVLTFIDMPGELWSREDGMGFDQKWYTEYEEIYKNLDCIWFFVSKWTAYNITTMNSEQIEVLMKQTAEHKEIVARGDAAILKANLSDLSKALKRSGKEMPPIAVILTKSDVDIIGSIEDTKKYNLFPVEGGWIAPAELVPSKNKAEIKRVYDYSKVHKRFILSEGEFWSTANLVRNFFLTTQEGALCEAIEENCPRRTYISMASYGRPAAELPQNESKSTADDSARHEEKSFVPVPPTPYHEMFPLLWTYAISGALPIEHYCEWYRENLLKKLILDAKEKVILTYSYQTLMSINAEIKRRSAEGNRNRKKHSREFDDSHQMMTDVETNMLLMDEGDGRFVVTRFNHKKG